MERILAGSLGRVAAADFFSVEVLTVGGLVRYLVFFVIDLKTRLIRLRETGRVLHAQYV